MCGLDEDVEVEDEEEREGKDRKKWVFVEEAEMERDVVEEAIGVVGFGGGARGFFFFYGVVEKGSMWNYRKR